MNHFHIDELIKRKPDLSICKTDIERFYEKLVICYKNGGKALICGNGGSCSDAGHIVAELMKGFRKKRRLSAEMQAKLAQLGAAELAAKLQVSFCAIDLTAMTALNTAFANDVDAECIYAQQAFAFAEPNDAFIGITTSGNAINVHYAAIAAKANNAMLLGLTGMDGGRMRESGLYDVIVRIPEYETYRIQEEHSSVYHAVCMAVEDVLFGEKTDGVF